MQAKADTRKGHVPQWPHATVHLCGMHLKQKFARQEMEVGQAAGRVQQ